MIRAAPGLNREIQGMNVIFFVFDLPSCGSFGFEGSAKGSLRGFEESLKGLSGDLKGDFKDLKGELKELRDRKMPQGKLKGELTFSYHEAGLVV